MNTFEDNIRKLADLAANSDNHSVLAASFIKISAELIVAQQEKINSLELDLVEAKSEIEYLNFQLMKELM